MMNYSLMIDDQIIMSSLVTYEDSLKWDGTYLGVWVQSKVKKVDGSLYSFTYEDRTFEVEIIRANTAYICLVDELKPFFGLIKVGTHWFKSGTRCVIICNPRYYSSPTLLKFTSESKLKDSQLKTMYPVLFESLREIFVFRIIAGVNRTTRGSIKIHKFGKRNSEDIPILDRYIGYALDRYCGISIGEKEPASPYNEGELSLEIILNYFGQISLGAIAQNICRVRTFHQFDCFIISLSTHVEDTVGRIDRKLITVSNGIVQRAMSLLHSTLSEESTGILGPPT
jgi:hypothetical protein